MKYVDILLTTEADTKRDFGIERKDYKQVAVDLAGKFGFKVVTITLRDNPSVWRNTWTAIVRWRASTGHPLIPEARAREIDRFLRAVEWC